jgi:hypothetical protein
MGFAQGSAEGGAALMSGNEVKLESKDPCCDQPHFKDAGTITLHGGATADGEAMGDFISIAASPDGRVNRDVQE